MLQHEKELFEAMRGADENDFIIYAVTISELDADLWAERIGKIRAMVSNPPPIALLFVGEGTPEEGKLAGAWAREIVDKHIQCLEWLIDESDYVDIFGEAKWYPLGLRGVVALADWAREGKITQEGRAIVDAVSGACRGSA